LLEQYEWNIMKLLIIPQFCWDGSENK